MTVKKYAVKRDAMFTACQTFYEWHIDNFFSFIFVKLSQGFFQRFFHVLPLGGILQSLLEVFFQGHKLLIFNRYRFKFTFFYFYIKKAFRGFSVWKVENQRIHSTYPISITLFANPLKLNPSKTHL